METYTRIFSVFCNARALRQVFSTPKVEHMRFDGDPTRYVSFIQTCLQKDNPDNVRRLQLVTQRKRSI